MKSPFSTKTPHENVYIDKKRHLELYLRMRGMPLDKVNLPQLVQEQRDLVRNTSITRSSLKGLLNLFTGDVKGYYRPSQKSITVKEPYFGSKRRKERVINKALIHEMMHAVDDTSGELNKPLNRRLTVASNIGRMGLNANIILQLASRVADFSTEHDIVPMIADKTTAWTALVGIAAYRLNPSEKKARSAERVFFDANLPIINFMPQDVTTPVPPLPAQKLS